MPQAIYVVGMADKLAVLDVDNLQRATHARHQQPFAVGSKDRAAEQIAGIGVTVHRLVKRMVELQLLTDCDGPQMMPVLYVRSRYVDQSDGVVAPMRHGYPSVVGRCGNHFGQRAGLEHAYYRIRAGVYDGHGRRILGVYVERAPIKRDPQVSAVVTQSAFHRFADKFPSVAVVIMGKSIVT